MYDGWKVLSFLESMVPIVGLLFITVLAKPTGKGHGHRGGPPRRYHGGDYRD